MFRLKIYLISYLITNIVCGQSIESEKRILLLMGSRFEITAIATSKVIAKKAVDEGINEIIRIEKLISEWDSLSQTSSINRMAGIQAVQVDKELFDLTYRSLKVSALTDGAFDISFASIENLWNFDRREHLLPDSNLVRQSVHLINWRNIKLNAANNSVYLLNKGMKIGFGANGKGYAANKAKKIMESIPGVLGGVVNASGDLIAWGKSNKPEGWSIQIADPQNKNKSLGYLQLNNMSIVTSGDYEKYFMNKGVRYSHIIDPKTGYPVTEIKSATIICPDAELSDALATSVCVLGVEKGLLLINQLADIECLIIDKNNKIHTSDKLKLNYY